MPRTSYDPVLDANRPQSGGFYPSWWAAEAERRESVPTQVADFIFGPEWAAQRRKAEATPPWSGERWRFGGETLFPFLMMGGGSRLRGGTMLPRRETPPSLLDQIEALNKQMKAVGERFQKADEVFDKFQKSDFKLPTAEDMAAWEKLTPAERTARYNAPLKPFDPAQFKEAFPPSEPYSPIPPVPSDPLEAQQFWKAFDRGMLPGQGGKSAFQQPMEWQNWKYLPRPEDLIGGGYHSDDPALGFMEPGDVPPPYGYQSPLKITPEDIAKVPTPPGIVITPQDVGQLPAATPFTAEQAFNIQKLGLKPPNLSNLEYQRAYDQFIQEQAAKTGDGHEVPGGLFFKNQFPGYQLDYQYGPGLQPEVPARFLPPAPDPTPPPTFDFGEFGYIYPQMPFYPQTDWYRSLRDVQSYPGENAYAIA